MSKKINIGELLMCVHLRELKLDFRTQVQFHATRMWRWDFVVEDNIAIEIDGYFRGKHGAGYGADNEKQNFGVMAGYRVLRFSTQDVKTGKAKQFLADWLKK